MRRRLSIVLLLLCFPGLFAAAPAPADELAIDWEISNRFAPFELLDDPEAWFTAYALREGESWRDWHARKWAETGPALVSPYAQALRLGAPLPWDEGRETHAPALLDFIRREDDPDVTVAVRLRVETDAYCLWQVGGALIPAQECRQPVAARIPLAGATVSVQFPQAAPGALPAFLSARLVPEHLVIVAMGDSYGSGEGNPDLPARWRAGLAPVGPDVNWLLTGRNVTQRARWLSDRCHRSFFSHQSLTAFGLASRDKHRFVSFLHFACSGAEIFDGLLAPQKDPGAATGYNRFSQINAARRALCRTAGAAPARYGRPPADWLAGADPAGFKRNDGVRLRPGSRFDWRLRNSAGEDEDPPRDGILVCPGEDLRVPDMLLLSIGGNDVGFGELVRYFVAPVKSSSRTGTRLILPKVCPAPEFRADPLDAPYAGSYCAGLDARNRYHAGDLIGRHDSTGGIRARLGLALGLLRHGLGLRPHQIVMAHYPDPLRESEASATPCWPVARPADVHGGPVIDPASPWNGLKAADPTGFFRVDEFSITTGDATRLLYQFDALRFQMALAARLDGFTLACAARDAMVGLGWWRGRHLNLPSDSGPGLAPWRPALWQPYRFEADGRAVRTGNDSLLTQSAGGAVAIHGTAHPNLAGHSLIADAVMARIERAGEIDALWAASRATLSPAGHNHGPF